MTKRNSIFVFGSNLKGIHGAGAAKYAAINHGAIASIGEGLMGSCYALPTKRDPRNTLPIGFIDEHVQTFLSLARVTLDHDFHLTKVGCGLAGHREDAIASLFKDAPDNVHLIDDAGDVLCPARQWHTQAPNTHFRVIVAGSRAATNQAFIDKHLDRLLGDRSHVEVVCGEARGADKAGRNWCASRKGEVKGQDLQIASFPANWDAYGKSAGHRRNAQMQRYANALIAFRCGNTPGTRNMINISRKAGLKVCVIDMPGGQA